MTKSRKKLFQKAKRKQETKIKGGELELGCDNCKQGFVIDSKSILSRYYGEGVEHNYFTCPHCAFEYLVSITDEDCRRWITARSAIRKTLNKLISKKDGRHEEELRKGLEEDQRLAGLLKARAVELKERYIHGGDVL